LGSPWSQVARFGRLPGACVPSLAVNPTPAARSKLPVPLLVALVVVGMESLVLLVMGILELVSLDTARPEVALTAGLFFLAYAAFLAFFTWRLARLESWARAPLVMGQLIQIPVGLSYWGGDTRFVTVALLAAAGVALVGIFHPASIAAIEAAED